MSRCRSFPRIAVLAIVLCAAAAPPTSARDDREVRAARDSADRQRDVQREQQRSADDAARRGGGGDKADARGAGSSGAGVSGSGDQAKPGAARKLAEERAKDEAKAREDAEKAEQDRLEDLAKAAEDAAKDAEDAVEDAEKERRETVEESHGAVDEGARYKIERGTDGRERLRGEVLMVGSADAVAQVRAAGYVVRSEQVLPALGESVLRIAVRPGDSVEQALQQLRGLVPGISVAPNHIYRPSQLSASARLLPVADPAPTAAVDLRRVLGLIDTGVDLRSPLLAGAVVRARSFAGGEQPRPRAHGTLVAEIAARHGARLALADVFGADDDDRLIAPADAIAAALAWLVAEQVPIINISIEGPDNAVMALLVARATAAGVVVVAAAGNGGPAAAPVYPAAYPGVIAVTAIDDRDQVYRRANRGPYISFAAPGVNIVSVSGSYDQRPVSGTSFAAPMVAALIAGRLLSLLPSPGRLPNPANGVLDALRRGARDLGVAGRDPVYGWGAIVPMTPDRVEARDAGGGATLAAPWPHRPRSALIR